MSTMNFDSAKKILIDEAVSCGLEDYEIYFTQSSSISAETLKDDLSSFASGSGSGISFRCASSTESVTFSLSDVATESAESVT